MKLRREMFLILKSLFAGCLALPPRTPVRLVSCLLVNELEFRVHDERP